MPDAWLGTRLGSLLSLEYGKALPERERDGIGYPVFGSNGVVGHHSRPLVQGPGIVVGRKGTAGSVTWTQDDFFPIDTTYWVRPFDLDSLDLRFAALLLEQADLPGVCAQTGVPGLNRERAYDIEVLLPSFPDQRRIVDLIGALDEQIEVLVAEACEAQRVHEGLSEALIVGPSVTVQEIADGRRGLVGGPFGSSLTTKHYAANGIPVIRGTNMPKAGRFIRGEFVFVSPDKAASLSSNLAKPGDVIFTQRGTLGQVGLVPDDYPMLVVSQSQMRLRVDPSRALAEYVYFAFSRPSVVRDMQQQNTATANPHINLGILSKQQMPLPDVAEQERLVNLLLASSGTVEALQSEIATVQAARQVLLGSLLGGQVQIPDSYDAFFGAV